MNIKKIIFFSDSLRRLLQQFIIVVRISVRAFFILFKQLKKDIEQLNSFTYAAQFKMHDRNLILFGDHLDRLMVYNIKVAMLFSNIFLFIGQWGNNILKLV